jgi:hypothetical protein
MNYSQLLRELPMIGLFVGLGVFCLALVRISRNLARLRHEETNLRKRLSDDRAT